MGEGRPQWDDECDVLVVGSGAGALTGAYVAAAQGLRTVVLEKTGLFGGTSAYSGASCWLPDTRVQVRAQLDDSTEQARTYLRSLLGEENEARREAFLTTAPHLAELLERHPDLEFEWRAFPDYFARPGRLDHGRSIFPLDLPPERLGDLLGLLRPPVGVDRANEAGPAKHPETLTGGGALIGRLLLALTSTGHAGLRPYARMHGLVVGDGRVMGAEADIDGRTVRISAQRGVLLAAGGFEGNAVMREANRTPGDANWTMGPRGTNTGEPIMAAAAIGAATDLTDEAWWCPAVLQPDGSAAFMLGLRGGLFVDPSGRRFANESLPYDQMGRVLARGGGAATSRVPTYFVFDSRSGGRLPAISIPDASEDSYLDSGAWARAGTLDELATAIGVPADALAATVQEFNEYAHTGVDRAFHRGEDPYDRFFALPDAAPNRCLVPVDKPPFYAARIVLGDLGTKGGLRTDECARVLREDGSVIEGLYAAGNTSASLSGRVYPGPGIPIGTAMVFSYLAARHMSARS